jgi:hypothetical protein
MSSNTEQTIQIFQDKYILNVRTDRLKGSSHPPFHQELTGFRMRLLLCYLIL